MSQPPTLNPAEQKEHLDKIAIGLVEALPSDWRELTILFDRLGRAAGFGARLTRFDGSHERWRPPNEILQAFDRLRAGMHVDGEGTWFSCRFTLVPPGRWDIQYSRSEQPRTAKPPTPEEFAREQRRFPRSDANMPDWYRAGLATVD
jgi:hypothetical protein